MQENACFLNWRYNVNIIHLFSPNRWRNSKQIPVTAFLLVGIQYYGLDSAAVEVWRSLFTLSIQSGLVVHSASYKMSTGAFTRLAYIMGVSLYDYSTAWKQLSTPSPSSLSSALSLFLPSQRNKSKTKLFPVHLRTILEVVLSELKIRDLHHYVQERMHFLQKHSHSLKLQYLFLARVIFQFTH